MRGDGSNFRKGQKWATTITFWRVLSFEFVKMTFWGGFRPLLPSVFLSSENFTRAVKNLYKTDVNFGAK